MTQKSALVFLDDMLEALQQIEQYVQGLDFAELSQNRLVVDGVIRNLEIVGEAANNRTDEIKTRVQDIPWSNIISLRNVLIHEYFGVDLSIVWEIITKDLPPTKMKVQALVENLEKNN